MRRALRANERVTIEPISGSRWMRFTLTKRVPGPTAWLAEGFAPARSVWRQTGALRDFREPVSIAGDAVVRRPVSNAACAAIAPCASI